ncbi:MAG: hypothetical protein KDA97_04910 [Acidimicrobiales bacterium]|nr:hypothetical protein [Acidimicrobiales bacterium]
MRTRSAPDLRAWARGHVDDLAAVGLYAAVRAVLLGPMGLRMDLRFLTFAPHLPDLGLLQDRLLETLWYTHTQPPLYAGFVGLLLKLSPFPDGATFLVAHLALGATLVVLLRRLAEALGLGRVATFVGLTLVVTDPALIAIELVASYDLPTIVLLAALALRTARYVASGSAHDLAWVTGLAGATVLTRTVFHPVWFVLVVVGVVAMRRPSAPWRPVAAVVAAPLVMILALVAKNAVLYGEPTLTTFAGPSLAKIAGSAATPAEREALQADGTVSELFGRPVFWGYETYADAMAPCERDRPDVPVLAEPDRPVGGYPNMNDECMLAVYRVQTDDAEAYVRAEPRRFAAAQLGGAQMFFEPALPIIFTTNADELEPLDDLYAATLLRSVQLQPVTRTEFGELRVLSAGGIDLVPTVVALDLAAVALGLRAAARLVARRDRRGGEAARTELGAWAAVGLTCAWVTAVGSLLEVNENARYRQLIEPFLLLVLAWLGQQAWHWWQGRSGRVDVDVEADVEDGRAVGQGA